MEQQQSRIKLFYSSDPSDDRLRDKLVRFLRPLVREAHIDEWSTQHALAGASVAQERKHALDSATHILLLLSADYLAVNPKIQWLIPRDAQRATSKLAA